ncbi:MAG: Holliday junction resolvase RuvX [Ignavibacteriales bacterium]|nr:Holliday junction resolvase RuvX [Ignavibacteriales bacterium]
MDRILAIDYGSIRIGLAMSDPLKIIAQGLKTIRNDPNAVAEITKVVRENNVSTIVVGKPLNLSGNESSKSVEVDAFVRTLKEKITVEIVMVDERFTSVMAQRAILAMGAKKKQRQNKGKVDEVASAILLQGYLDSLKR